MSYAPHQAPGFRPRTSAMFYHANCDCEAQGQERPFKCFYPWHAAQTFKQNNTVTLYIPTYPRISMLYRAETAGAAFLESLDVSKHEGHVRHQTSTATWPSGSGFTCANYLQSYGSFLLVTEYLLLSEGCSNKLINRPSLCGTFAVFRAHTKTPILDDVALVQRGNPRKRLIRTFCRIFARLLRVFRVPQKQPWNPMLRTRYIKNKQGQLRV